MSANSTQVGGDHYKAHGTAALQHWDMVDQLAIGYFQGNITKYLFRWRSKNGLQDLEKAGHYLQKYIEISGNGYYSAVHTSDLSLYKLIEVFKLDYFQGSITQKVVWWRSVDDLREAARVLQDYISQVSASPPVTVVSPLAVQLSPEMEQRARDIEWDNGDEATPAGARDSNAHPAEPGGTLIGVKCILCGGIGEHLPNCDRAIKPAMLYRGPDEPLTPADPATLRPLQPAAPEPGSSAPAPGAGA